jgi:Rrf2 family protein
MLEIAKQSRDGSPVSLSQVAEQGDLPRRYLEQLVIALKRDSLLRGVSGKDGGYCLTRPPSEIKVGDIIESSIGQISIVDCVEDPRQCLKSELCECRPMYALINQRITEVLNEFSLADMLENKWHQGETFIRKGRKVARSAAPAKSPPGSKKAVAK